MIGPADVVAIVVAAASAASVAGGEAAAPPRATLVAPPPGQDEGCPSPRQITEALRTRVPGALTTPDAVRSANALQVVIRPAEGQGLDLTLVTPAGEVKLDRRLRSAGACPALAQTIAIIVERYLEGLEAPVPAPSQVASVAPATPPPRVAAAIDRAWDLHAGGGWRAYGRPGGPFELELGGARLLGSSRRWALTATLGVGAAWQARYADGGVGGRATGRRIPLAMGLARRFPIGPGEIQVGGGGGLDLLLATARAGGREARVRRLGPFAAVQVGYRLPVGPRAFVRLGGVGGAPLKRYEFIAARRRESFSTTRVEGKLELVAGVALW